MAEEGSTEPRPRQDSTTSRAVLIDEETPLLPGGASETTLWRTISRRSEHQQGDSDDHDKDNDRPKTLDRGVYATISVLLLGVFISQTDQSLVLATYSIVASEFNDLNSGSWILSSFIIAQCVAQPLYGKLSDIYGRKACLQAAYVLFALGTAGTGFGQTMGQVIAARAIQGAGSSGMLSIVSIIITDLVPISEVATLRSYVNVLQTTGRSCGGVIGGALTQALGWRWAFFIQLPPTILAILLVQWRLHVPLKHNTSETKWEKLKRIDFLGALFLCITIFSGCFVLDTGGQKYAWQSPLIISLISVFGVALIAFVVSAKFVPEPIFPLRIIRTYAVWTNYLIVVLQLLVQVSLMQVVPMYFQVTAKANTAQAGAYLIPAFFGNTIGGLLSGYFIKKTGLYKPVIVVAPILSILCMVICYTTWTGHTTIGESFAILPGGMAAGLVSSAAFVGLAAGVEENDMAVAGSGVYLSFNVGAIVGTSLGAAVFQTTLQDGLRNALEGVKDGGEIMRKALSDIRYVQTASSCIRDIIVPVFIAGFRNCVLLYMCCAGLCLLIALFSQSKRLKP